MKRYNWESLKKDFITGPYTSLNEFASQKVLKVNGNFKKRTKGWSHEKELAENIKSTKIIEKTIEKVAEKDSDRNVKFLQISDMALDAIEEFLKEQHYKKHVIKYKRYLEGKPQNEELIAETLDVADTKALINVITSLEKVQRGQRLSLGLDKGEVDDTGSLDALVAAIRRSDNA